MEAARGRVADIRPRRRLLRKQPRPKTPARGHGLTLGGEQALEKYRRQVAVPENEGRTVLNERLGHGRAVRKDEIAEDAAKAVAALPRPNKAQFPAHDAPRKRGPGCVGEVLGRDAAMSSFRGVDAGQAHGAPVGQAAGVAVEDLRHAHQIAAGPGKPRREQAGAKERHEKPAAAKPAAAGCEKASAHRVS
jgi:hypothetical protein